jgi:pimeloyl-ACP methyl ester carboxylesterase
VKWEAAQIPRVGEIPGSFLSVPGARLHYLDAGGDGLPVVLLHGINQNVRTWELVLPYLDGPWRLVALDHRGHGLSESDPDAYQSGDIVRDAEQFILALGLNRPVVVGHSLGAWVAIRLAAARPELLRGVVLGDISPNPAASMTPERYERMRAAFEDENQVSWADEDEAFAALAETLPEESPSDTRARIRQSLRVDEQGRLTPARSHRVALRIFEDLLGQDLWPLLPSIQVPARVVFAEDSDVLGRQDAERMVAELPRGELVSVPHAHHDLQLCQPKLWAEAITGFLRRVDTPGS